MLKTGSNLSINFVDLAPYYTMNHTAVQVEHKLEVFVAEYTVLAYLNEQF